MSIDFENLEERSFTVRIEDRISRYTEVEITAFSAAEAAVIARQMAVDGELDDDMEVFYVDRDPSVYRISDSCSGDSIAALGEMAGTVPNNGCLTENISKLFRAEGFSKKEEAQLMYEHRYDHGEYLSNIGYDCCNDGSDMEDDEGNEDESVTMEGGEV
jgi:hypothetical protein